MMQDSMDRVVDRVPLRIVGGFEVLIELPPVMTEASWAHMLRLLDAMKEGYVSESKIEVKEGPDGTALGEMTLDLLASLGDLVDDTEACPSPHPRESLNRARKLLSVMARPSPWLTPKSSKE